jgi:hypothetical protein
MKEQLPAHTVLLVTPLHNVTQTRFMQELGRLLRAAGRRVMVLSVG